MDFGKYLRNQRLKNGLTIRDVVEQSGEELDKTTVSRIERNERKLSLKAAYFFAEIYGIDLKALVRKSLGGSAKVWKVKPVKKKRGPKAGRPRKR